MALIFYLLLLFGQHPLVRVLAHDHMDQDLQDPSSAKEEEKTEKLVEVDVTKEYGVEVTKEQWVEVTKEYGIELVAIQVGEGSDENIIEMDVAMMESNGVEGGIESLKMEVFNEVVLEEILQVCGVDFMINGNHIHTVPILDQNPAL